MNKANAEISAIIKAARLESGLTQLAFGKKLGYGSAQFVCIFERGRAPTPLRILGQLIVILGISEKTVLKILMDGYREGLESEIAAGKLRAAGAFNFETGEIVSSGER